MCSYSQPFACSHPYRDGEQIEKEEDDEKYVFSDDSSELTIRKVGKDDEAEYVCIAENKAGEQDASIHLKVFGKGSGIPGRCSAKLALILYPLAVSKILFAVQGNISRMYPSLAYSTT